MSEDITKLKIESNNLKKEIRDLYVLIDTLQTNLRAIMSQLTDEQKESIQTPSLKWCLNWKPEKAKIFSDAYFKELTKGQERN